MSKLNLAICASSSSYTQVIAYSDVLLAEGINVILPNMAAKMKAEGQSNEEVVVD
jgi:hypothetical protein